MSRVYGEPVGVWVRDGRPVRFIWRGRLYTVLTVREQWVVSRERWQRPGRVPPGAVGREFWRVDAAPGRGVPPATYELRHDPGAGGWLLVRAWE